MTAVDQRTRELLHLTLTPGCGPVVIRRLLETFGSAGGVLGASASQMERVKGLGRTKSVEIRRGLDEAAKLVEKELARAEELGARVMGMHDREYPALLAQIPDAPPVLYCRGAMDPHGADRYPVAIVGARECSAYGIDQSRRFAGVLAGAGLTIVSGGARGIDSAAHRGAIHAGGRTVCVLGCGLAHAYPPENKDLFDEVAARFGAVVSELPMDAPPKAENFPARNRIIAGLSLGTIVIEAGERSGALITARLAAEDYGREVMALPGRVDAPASRGTLKLLKAGGAALVTEPGDVLAILESPARHAHGGTHEARFLPSVPDTPDEQVEGTDLFAPSDGGARAGASTSSKTLSEVQTRIIVAMDEGRTLDELAASTGLTPATLRAELTVLEIQQRVRRQGSRFERRE